MFGLSAKERMAQLQAKSAKDAQPAKPPGPAGLKKVGKLNGAGSKADDAAAKAKSPDNAKELLKAKQTEKKDQTATKKSKSPDETKVAPAETKPTQQVKEKKETEPAAIDKKDDVAESTPVEHVEDKKDDVAESKSPEQPEEKNETESATESKSPEQIEDKKDDVAETTSAEHVEEKKETTTETKTPDKVEETKAEVKTKEETSETASEPASEPKPTEVESKAAETKQDEPKAVEPEKKPEEKGKSEENVSAELKEPAKNTPPAAVEDKKEEKTEVTHKEQDKPTAAVTTEKTPQKATEETKASDEKPKEQSKPTEKPKEEAKKPEPKAPVAADEAKAKDAPKPKEAAAKPEAKPEAKPAEKQKDEAQKPASKAAEAEAKKPEAAPQPDAKAATKKAAPAPATEFKPTNDDLYSAIFYFSGMGSLLGSAMADGVYVPERSRKTALDVDEVESATKSAASVSRHGEQQVVSAARSQAQVLSNDFRQLLALLENMPSFGDKTQIDAALLPSGATKPVDRRGVEQPIHGHVYFQQPDRPQNQQHHHGDKQSQSKAAPGYQTPTAAAVQRADNEFGQSVVQIASLQPPSPSGWNRPGTAPGPVQVLPVGQSQANYTSSVYHQPQPSKTPTFNEGHGEGHGPHGGGGSAPHHRPQHHQQPPSQPWQDRYGPDATGRSQSAGQQRLQQHGDVDPSGVKPWQLSHLRALEAKGYRVGPSPAPVAPSPVAYGAADDQLDGEVRSFAPYLVSDRTMNADIKQTLKRTLGTGSAAAGAGSDGYLSSGPGPSSARGPSPYQQNQPRPYRPPSSTPNYPFSPAAEGSLPYCDF